MYPGVSSLVTLPWELWEATCMLECHPFEVVGSDMHAGVSSLGSGGR